jgi:hypothetical protein
LRAQLLLDSNACSLERQGALSVVKLLGRCPLGVVFGEPAASGLVVDIAVGELVA